MTIKKKPLAIGVALCALTLQSATSFASSHREAPFITEIPKVDGTDFYMFRSYESGRENYVTLIANYLPLQDAYGGPNYFDLDADAIYEIHIDNNADGVEDLTFQFQMQDNFQDIQLPIGNEMVSVPLKNIGDAADPGKVQFSQSYTLKMIQGDRRTGSATTLMNVTKGMETFDKPLDNIGEKSFPNGYANYASNFVDEVALPNCSVNGRVFVGQRKEAFAVNLGEIFDLVNTNPLGDPTAEGPGDLADKNVTSFALELPKACITGSAVTSEGQAIIGGWTTASVRQARIINPEPSLVTSEMSGQKGATVEGGAFTQVSRLGMPLVNEVVIGLKDKDKFNASEPKDDGQFLTYVTNPTLPALLEILFGGAGAQAPEINEPEGRQDLVAAFLTGLTVRGEEGQVVVSNEAVGVTASEMLRLNTETPVTPLSDQDALGVLGGDIAGFPNGRRPYDDTVDVALRVVMGALIPGAPNQNVPFTDGVRLDRNELPNQFPYLATPIAGSPNDDVMVGGMR